MAVKTWKPLWEIESAETLHKVDPQAFPLPSKQTRDSVPDGYFVKLIFYHVQNGGRERLWVKVVKRLKMSYIGTLHSRPVNEHLRDAISPGEMVAFGPEHICGISLPK